ncbi:MAG: outer membrane protein transport protein [Gammaproteobacteria bacterium]|nr:outer membrane protein transport protein [Gammaproteobacteria bacterium]MCP5425230.1 outer membrane protein transport protein [Gammaproteobacteria bacterium]MCP5459616.1 outer membrane protein transport protein [Gammaproteobacteria bacterium]
MQTKTYLCLSRVAIIASVLCYADSGQAGAFQVTELCGLCQGVRNAGQAAAADSGATVFFNPAGLTYRKGRQADISLHTLFGKFEFQDNQSTNAIGGQPIGRYSNDGAEPAFIPNLYYTQEINENLTFGVGLTTPYGLLTEYDKHWIGRYNAIKSELATTNINPSLGYKINDKLSVGAGLMLQYIEADLTSAVDFGAIGFLLGIPGVTPSTPAFDGFNQLTGDDWGLGWNLGLLFEPQPGTRLGISYRSGVNLNLEGQARITVPDSIASVVPGLSSRRENATVDFTSPAILMLGAYHEINERWAIMAGAWWTDWSQFDEIRIKFKDGSPDAVQPENWHDSWRYQLGVSYQYSPQWTLRAGLEYDESPVNEKDLTPRVPDSDRTWLAIGASYHYSPQFSLDFAYTHIFISDYDISDTEVTTGAAVGAPIGNTLDGTYDADANILSVGLRWSF